ncbi:MAG TPA: MnmC family methyltransferase [Spirochaetota bacterium]|nr:MnmC family methyltransferase [Spirochaetota bacterium]
MTGMITTNDGSATLFLDEYDQAMHSTSGAYEEALFKHVQPSMILEKKKESLTVLDVGFGLGYNVLALMDRLNTEENHSLLNIVSLEKDESFYSYMESVRFGDQRDLIYGKIKTGYLKGSAEFDNIRLKILFGDARDSIKNITGIKFDAVFQDPFSPAKNPELWTVEYFRLLAGLMYNEAILTTYSSADHIRMAMIEAGFIVGKGPSVGQKREGTLAALTDVISTLDNKRILDIRENPKSEPYRDPGLNLTREMIIENRLESIRRKKTTGYHQVHQV